MSIYFFQKHTVETEYKRKLNSKPIDTEDSLSLWDHCVKGHGNSGIRSKTSKTKGKLDLRSHLNPFEAVDVYKVSQNLYSKTFYMMNI